MANFNYDPTTWVNNETPLNQTNMNHIEEGIVGLTNLRNQAPFTSSEYNTLLHIITSGTSEYKNYYNQIYGDRVTSGGVVTGIKLSVNGDKTTYITLTKGDIGLSNVDNTADNVKYVARAVLADTATADADGNTISSTYIKKQGFSGGSTVQPVYIENGVIKNTTYQLNKTVPSDAVFTDTINLTQMTGVLPVSKGGTGKTTAAESRTALGLGDASVKSVKDTSLATALTNSGTNLVTERAVYYALPTINGAHNYTSSTNIYAPTTVGSNTQVLTSNGSSVQWSNYVDKALKDDAGNNIRESYASSFSISGSTITLKNKNGVSLGTVTTPNTTYTLSQSNNQLVFTPSSGSATNITVAYATASGSCSGNAATATKATQDASGNVITSTYSKKADAIKTLTFNSNGTVTIVKDSGTSTTSTVYGTPSPAIEVSSTAPTNHNIIWVDSANGYIAKAWYSNAWHTLRGAWG